MQKRRAALTLLFLMIATLVQSAIHHAYDHEEDNTACEYCLIVDQSQPCGLVGDTTTSSYDSVDHSIYTYEESLRYLAFAKADFLKESLSIRPPPFYN